VEKEGGGWRKREDGSEEIVEGVVGADVSGERVVKWAQFGGG